MIAPPDVSIAPPRRGAARTPAPGVARAWTQPVAPRPGERRPPAVLVLQPRQDAGGALASYPGVRAALAARGVAWERAAGEDLEAHETRLATALMALYRDTGDADAFEALYAVARRGVLSWIKGLLSPLGRRMDPVELLQDTFVNVYRYPRAFRDDRPESFRVWVRTIAGNLVRRSGARTSRTSLQALPEGLQEPVDGRADPAQLALDADERKRLREAWMLFLLLYARTWKDLSPRDRRTLHLIEVEGLSYVEAGRVLGVGHSNMKMIVFRSRQRIAHGIGRAFAAARVSAASARLEVA